MEIFLTIVSCLFCSVFDLIYIALLASDKKRQSNPRA